MIPDEYVTVSYHTETQNGVVTINESAITGTKMGTVRVTATAQTTVGKVSADFDVIVSSAGAEDAVVELQSRTVKNAQGQIIGKLESGTLEIGLTVKAKENTTAKVYVAFVDENGRLRSCGESADVMLTKNIPSDISAGITVPENVKGELYVFIWESVNTLKPLYEKMVVF